MGVECLDLGHLAGHVTETLFAFWSLSGPCVVLTMLSSWHLVGQSANSWEMEREAWSAAVRRVAESDTVTEQQADW